MDTIALKIKTCPAVMVAIRIIRKYRKVEIGKIKAAIEEKRFFLECDYLSLSGIRKIRKCYDELLKAGIECEIYDEDEELIDREILDNMIESYRETEKETAAQMDAKAEDT